MAFSRIKAVIAQLNLSDDTAIQLCETDDHITPFVTWQVNLTTNDRYWGHYLSNIDAAWDDFTSRAHPNLREF